VGRSRALAIVTPVYNDWESLHQLVLEIDGIAAALSPYQIEMFAINDGSTEQLPRMLPSGNEVKHVRRVELVNLVCNIGHQRAIAIGLSTVAERGRYDFVLVMDADGEDDPSYIEQLLRCGEETEGHVVVARRVKRSEGTGFRVFYFLYRCFFRAVTGRSISFGNFCLIPSSLLQRIVFMPDVWNHLAASITRARLPITSVSTVRGARYAGASTMNLVSLIIHGLSAISVYADFAFVRILLVGMGMGLVTVLGMAVAAGIRFLTDLAIPGWATNVVGIMLIIMIQAVILSLVAVFLLLSGRSNAAIVPALVTRDYIQSTDVLIQQ